MILRQLVIKNGLEKKGKRRRKESRLIERKKKKEVEALCWK